ncbi:MAG: hypothetical protein R2698_15035 [Microthrixaceae bacterium]
MATCVRPSRERQFIIDDGLSPLTQAAVAHARLETIRPFIECIERVRPLNSPQK